MRPRSYFCVLKSNKHLSPTSRGSTVIRHNTDVPKKAVINYMTPIISVMAGDCMPRELSTCPCYVHPLPAPSQVVSPRTEPSQ